MDVIVSMHCLFRCLFACVIQPSENTLQVLGTHLRPRRNDQKILRWGTPTASRQPDLQGTQRNEQSLVEAGGTIHLWMGNPIIAGVSIASVGKLPIYGYVINFWVEKKVITTQAWKWYVCRRCSLKELASKGQSGNQFGCSIKSGITC